MIDYVKDIKKLKKEKNAVILAHYYQIPEIQNIADFVGDSLGLARQAEKVEADIIVFAGVNFMAETAKILNPQKKVLLPDYTAGCSLADSANADDFLAFKAKYPDHMVISYVNCTAAVKTMSDLIVTSGNAVELVNALPKDKKIIFAPDKNLGAYVNKVTGRDMLLWDGTCCVHNLLTPSHIQKSKDKYSNSEVLAHPECRGSVLDISDFVGSTAQMLDYAKNNKAETFLIASETGLLHQLQKDSPEKEFVIIPSVENAMGNDCRQMKKNTMEKLYLCLKNESPELLLDDDTIAKSKVPIEKMLRMSKDLKIIK